MFIVLGLAPANVSPVTDATVVTMNELPSPLYDLTLFDESNALPEGAPWNVVIGTNVSPSSPMGIGAAKELGRYNLLFVANNPPYPTTCEGL